MSYDKTSAGTFIAHFSDPNYDPVKAHAYYLRTRQLKGRQSTKGFTDTQKEGLAFVKAQVSAKKKTDLTNAQTNQQSNLEAVRKKAEDTRTEIMAKLQAFEKTLADQHVAAVAKLDLDAKRKRQAVTNKLKSDIAALPPIPDSLSAMQKRHLQVAEIPRLSCFRGRPIGI